MSGSRPTNAWIHRAGRLEDRWWRAHAYLDDRFPDGTKLDPRDDPGDLTDVFWAWATDVDEARHLVITINPAAVPGASDLWFVAIEERHGRKRHTTSLVAFDTDHFPDGTVVTNAEFVPMKVRSDRQAAAIRWWREEAVVDQIFVRADIRRTHVGLKIIYTAASYHQAHGWPGVLHSDGRRTDLGERLATGVPHPQRISAWDERMAPMDPEEGGVAH